jgi:hypothetical protein
MRDHVGDVGKLLLEIALIRLQAIEQLAAAREAAAAEERRPRAAAAMSMSVLTTVHVHLLSS